MTATHTPLRLPVAVFGSVIILLHLLALFFPSGVNWGFHHLAFLPPAVSIPIIILMVMALLPQVQERVGGIVDRLAKQRSVVWWVTSLCILGLLFWVLRQRTFFLGDGYLVIRNLSLAPGVANLPAPFPTATLSAFCAYQLKAVLAALHGEPAAQIAWQVQSLICGVAAVPVAFRLAGSLSTEPSVKWVSALFLLVGGASQLFFGYVETYPPAYVATMVFLWLSLEFLYGKRSLIFPFLAFGLLFTLHFGMLSLIPAVGVLFVVGIQRKGIGAVLPAVIATPVFVVLILLMCGYTTASFFEVLFKGGTYFLPLTLTDNWQAAYSLFSGWHFIDIANATLLLSPFVPILFPLALFVMLRRGAAQKPETIFLSLAMLAAVGWIFLTNFEVGMSRDWDVLAPLSVCVVAFSIHGLLQGSERVEELRPSFLAMVIITLLHTVAWIAVNADEDRSIARYALVQDKQLRSHRALAYAWEDLAGFYRDRKEYANAIPFMEKTVAIDSTNARRWLSLANIYQRAGDKENAIRAYEESARWGIRDKAAFFNLGVLYYNRGRLHDAIAMLQHAAVIDSADTLISSNLRLVIARKTAGEGPRK